MTPTAILHDVLESVHAMLPQRDPKFEIQVECPENLLAMSDRLRLKQVCLNLARNSVKFIQKGFIRLRAEVIDNEVNIFVEDSGPGIPLEKREILFNKFQESLDSLSQGTVRWKMWQRLYFFGRPKLSKALVLAHFSPLLFTIQGYRSIFMQKLGRTYGR